MDLRDRLMTSPPTRRRTRSARPARPVPARLVGRQHALVACDELLGRRELGRVGAQPLELATLADLVCVLDRVEVGRVDLVGERLQLAAVALDPGLDDGGRLAALDLLDRDGGRGRRAGLLLIRELP